MASQCPGLVRRSKPVQRIYKHFFKDFEPRSALPRLIRLRLLVKMILIENARTKSLYFGYFWRFVTHVLAIGPRPTYIYVLWAIFGFFIFSGYLLLFLEAKSKIIAFYTKFWARHLHLLRLSVLVCCFAANTYNKITSIFSKVSKPRADSVG